MWHLNDMKQSAKVIRRPSVLCPPPSAGFTLVEMLVVIGIIAILSAALMASFSHVKMTARQSQAQNLVSEVATAFNLYLQQERGWGKVLITKTEMDEEACGVLQDSKLLDVHTYKSNGEINTDSVDRYGLLDPWGQSMLRGNPNLNRATAVKHRLQIRLDLNLDGFVDASEGAPEGLKIRAAVIVWSRGPDGEDGDAKGGRYPGDDRLSWSLGAALSEQQ